jgi:hypothetical protein
MDDTSTHAPLTSSSHVYPSWINPAPSPYQNTHPLGMRHVFPVFHATESGHHQPSRSYVVGSSPSSVLFSPTQPSVLTVTILHLAPHQPNTAVHYQTPFGTWSSMTQSNTLPLAACSPSWLTWHHATSSSNARSHVTKQIKTRHGVLAHRSKYTYYENTF